MNRALATYNIDSVNEVCIVPIPPVLYVHKLSLNSVCVFIVSTLAWDWHKCCSCPFLCYVSVGFSV